MKPNAFHIVLTLPNTVIEGTIIGSDVSVSIEMSRVSLTDQD
jgi:hypothetical protein